MQVLPTKGMPRCSIVYLLLSLMSTASMLLRCYTSAFHKCPVQEEM